MTFAEHWSPSRHGRMTHPDELAEAAVLDRLAELTERHGPRDAALLMFGTDYAGRVA